MAVIFSGKGKMGVFNRGASPESFGKDKEGYTSDNKECTQSYPHPTDGNLVIAIILIVCQ